MITAMSNPYTLVFGQPPLEVIERDTDRDHWLTSEEAVAYGIIDGVVKNR